MTDRWKERETIGSEGKKRKQSSREEKNHVGGEERESNREKLLYFAAVRHLRDFSSLHSNRGRGEEKESSVIG